ncbi:hypothetical protein U27_03655 [Candidatus Vecturithrix granuli]|uniref:Uncharacterized protein n=1 Tax=Vecturithrix granuli TaxID=1499967 RepID=A0A081BWI7_VECG1|nr:hypothetical protein U27_03655 [Candidatus Vecturithrix granuli]
MCCGKHTTTHENSLFRGDGMSRETPVSRLSTMRETGVSRDIFRELVLTRRNETTRMLCRKDFYR